MNSDSTSATLGAAPDATTSTLRFNRPWLMGAAAIVVITIIAYIPALRAGYIWDDDSYLTANKILRKPDGLVQIWTNIRSTPQYYPLVFTTFWLEYRLWGLHPFGYHLVNVLLHAGSALMFWYILRHLRVPGAWLGALIFAIHPVHVESVAWITERKNTLSLFFYLLAAICFFKFDPIEPVPEEKPRDRRIFYVLSMLCFLAAMFSKTVTCSLPAALMVIYWWKRPKISIRDLIPFIAMFAFGLIMAQITSWLEAYHVGAKYAKLGLTPWSRIVLSGQIFWFYAGKLVWPWPLIFIYEKWKVDPAQPVQWLWVISFIALAITLFLMRHRLTRAPLVVLLLYAMTLTPALGFVDVYPMVFSWVADHFQYHASLAPIAAIGAILAWLFGKIGAAVPFREGSPSLPRGFALGPVVILAAILGGLTMNQTRMYADAETLWRKTVQMNDKAAMAHNNLGATISTFPGKDKEAEKHLRRALELNPQHGHAYVNLAVIYMNRGDFETAEKHLEKALECASEIGASPEMYHNLGLCFAQKKNWDEAVKNYKLAITIRPDYGPAIVSLSDALEEKGEFAEADKYLKLAVETDPDSIEKYISHAGYRLLRGETKTAIRYYKIALLINPEHAQANYNLAGVLSGLGRSEEAMRHIERAIRSSPNFPDAYNVKGVILTHLNRPAEAIDPLRKATTLDPNNPDAHFNLANAYAAVGQTDQALVHYKEVLRLNPQDNDVREIVELITKQGATLKLTREQASATSAPALPATLPARP